MVFGSEDVLPVYGSFKTYIMMATNMKDYVTLDDDLYDADLRFYYRDNMMAQFEQYFYNKSFSHQDQDQRDDVLQRELKFGLIMLLNWEDQYLIMFMILITRILD